MRQRTLDLETSDGTDNFASNYALEPWRARQGKAFISSVHVYDDEGYYAEIERPTREQLVELLEEHEGYEMVCHNAIFDVAWLIASIEPDKRKPVPKCVRKIRWRCSMLLAKWVVNGRLADDMHFGLSLVNLCLNLLKGEEGLDEFVAIKQGVVLDPSNPYWKIRGKLDVIWTHKLYKYLLTKLPKPSWRGYVIEQSQIKRFADSWLTGLWVNQEKLDKAEFDLNLIVAKGCEELGVSSSVIASPAQLGKLVFGDWGFTPISKTPMGQASTAADDFKLIAYVTRDQRLLKIVAVKQAMTLLSKFVAGTRKALERTGDGYLYGAPRLFGTTSGRLTYSSETKKGMQVSIAQHQIPRKDKIIRAFLEPPPGMKVWEADAASQESRIMGIWSRDAEIIRIFREGINFHGYMAMQIYGRAVEEIMAAVKAEDPVAIEQRQMGKLTNLSCNFRIGGPKLAKKSFTEYDTYMEEHVGRSLVKTFNRSYPGVSNYWKSIIAFAKENGYTYTLAQRRWKVPKEMLQGSEAWKVEGTVISHPIQGTGGDMMYAALTQLDEDDKLQTSLHDGQFFVVPDDQWAKERTDEMLRRMNATPYESLWALNKPLAIPLEYEGTKLGKSYADVK